MDIRVIGLLGNLRLLHMHDLVCYAIRFLLVLISRLADGQLGLNQPGA